MQMPGYKAQMTEWYKAQCKCLGTRLKWLSGTRLKWLSMELKCLNTGYGGNKRIISRLYTVIAAQSAQDGGPGEVVDEATGSWQYQLGLFVTQLKKHLTKEMSQFVIKQGPTLWSIIIATLTHTHTPFSVQLWWGANPTCQNTGWQLPRQLPTAQETGRDWVGSWFPQQPQSSDSNEDSLVSK